MGRIGGVSGLVRVPGAASTLLLNAQEGECGGVAGGVDAQRVKVPVIHIHLWET